MGQRSWVCSICAQCMMGKFCNMRMDQRENLIFLMQTCVYVQCAETPSTINRVCTVTKLSVLLSSADTRAHRHMFSSHTSANMWYWQLHKTHKCTFAKRECCKLYLHKSCMHTNSQSPWNPVTGFLSGLQCQLFLKILTCCVIIWRWNSTHDKATGVGFDNKRQTTLWMHIIMLQ